MFVFVSSQGAVITVGSTKISIQLQALAETIYKYTDTTKDNNEKFSILSVVEWYNQFTTCSNPVRYKGKNHLRKCLTHA